MARVAKAATTKQAAAKRSSAAQAKATAKTTAKAPAKTARSTTSGKSTAAVKRMTAEPAPAKAVAAKGTPTKEELRVQVEKLEKANATLRIRQRTANRAAKESAARIEELETELAALQRRVDSMSESKPPRIKRAARKSRKVDPGDAVPEGVAVEEAEPLDHEAETALGNLEEHLSEEEH